LWISLNRIVTHQRREIGIELSLGVPPIKILGYYVSYGIIIGLFSMLIAWIGGWYFGLSLDQVNKEFFFVPEWTNSQQWKYLIQAWIGCFGCSFLAALIPAYQAAQLLPVKAMRQDPALAVNYSRFRKTPSKNINRLQKKNGHKRQRNLTFRMALRNILRNRRRTTATILGFGLSIGIVISVIGIFSSIDQTIVTQVDQLGDFDMKINLYQPTPSFQLKNLTEDSRIHNYYYGFAFFGRIYTNSTLKQATPYEVIQLNTFSHPDAIDMMVKEGSLQNKSDSVCISAELALEIGIGLSQPIIVEHYFNLGNNKMIMKNTTLYVDAFHARTSKMDCFMEWGQVQRLMNFSNIIPAENYTNSIYVTLKSDPKTNSDSELRQFEKDVYLFPSVKLVEIRTVALENFQDYFEEFNDIMFGLQIMSYAIAFGVIFLTSTITHAERQREFGTMATLGTKNSTILNLAFWEAGILASIGIIFGLLLGLFILNVVLIPLMGEMFDSMIMMTYIPNESWLTVIGMGLSLALISQLPISKQLNKMDLAQATKVRDF
jgi:ABC-type antimicrobial peptide transport system permease subunit